VSDIHTMASTPNAAAVRVAESLLRQWIGLDVGTIGQAALERAVNACMRASGERNADAFADRLQHDVAERDRLVEEIVVAESWFFRDPPVFDVVRRFALQRTKVPGAPPLRILCVPAAGGEEPYSVAMSLLDAGLAEGRFIVDAVDVSRVALARAVVARYVANAFRAAAPDFRDRWFRMEGPTAVLQDEVRRTVTFAWGNILDDGFAAGRPPYDVIFCRNLLIYLTPDARARVERQIDRLLTSDGVLVLGAAEPAIMRGAWMPASEHSAFALRRAPAAAREPPTGGGAAALTRRAAPPSRPPAASPVSARRHDRGGRPDATTVDAVVRQAETLANAGRRSEALLLCQQHERQSGPAAGLFFLMGMIHQSTGDDRLAETYLQKTLSLDADHEDALLALSLLALRRGDPAAAEQYRQAAARVYSRKGLS